jgi:predicted metal-dependent hydrolase
MPELEYELIRSRRKTISIIITEDARVVVRAPLRASKALIEGFLEQKRRWVTEKQAIASQQASEHVQGGFLSGEEFPYLGSKLMLAVSEGAKRIDAVGGVLAFPRAWLPNAQERLKKWYRAEAARVVGERLKALSQHTGLRPASVGFTDARHRWGSCGADGRLNFSWRLVMAPPDVIDYVVVHELAHIRHLNHSREFWGCVGRIMPEYREKKKWLKENNALLRLF